MVCAVLKAFEVVLVVNNVGVECVHLSDNFFETSLTASLYNRAVDQILKKNRSNII